MEVEPGGLRELHWHPNTDEWQYFISGQGRMGVFASSGRSRTFDYQAGDVGYVPFAMGHYVQNTGDEPLRFLEMFRSDRFADISLNQWMALVPPELVKAHLNLDDATIGALKKDKPVLVPGTHRHAELPVLPEWPAMTIAVLSTLDQTPYAIPVTAPVRTGDRRIMFALRHERGSLARLVAQPQVALFIGEHDRAFTARGRAQIAAEDMPGAPGWVAIALEVEEIDDHRQGVERVESGITVEWGDEHAHEQLRNRVDALRELGRAM